MYQQGEIYFVDLDPAKGTEERKTPCIVVSNNQYNKVFNTIIVVPISSSKKYEDEIRFQRSPLFVSIHKNLINGTALLQHLRTIDPRIRIKGKVKGILTKNEVEKVREVLQQFF